MESYTSKYTGEQIDNSVAVGQQVSEELSLHVDNLSNPHKVTQAQVGLGNVNNTSDLDKPISTATQEALSQKASSSDVASVQATATNALTVANEAKSIAEGKTSSFVFDTVSAMNEWLANPSNTAQLSIGSNLYIRENGVPDYWWDGTTAIELESEGANLSDYYTSEQVDALLDTKASNLTVSNHINNQSNPHNVTQAQVGLGNVNNTSDLDKPISTATQTALDLKANQSALSQEISAREAADTSLNESISTETTNRQEADEALSQEITALTESLSDYVSVQPQSLSTAQQLQARTNIGAAPSSTIGIPSGGNSGQILAKTSDSNYAVSWEDPPIETPTAILYTPQVLTDEQKTQARENIGAGTGSGGGTTVVANPTVAATDTLTSLQVGDTVYSVEGGGTISIIDLGEQQVGQSFTITSEQYNQFISDNPPLVRVKISNVFNSFVYTFLMVRTALRGAYVYYGGGYIDDVVNNAGTYVTGLNITSTSAIFEINAVGEGTVVEANPSTPATDTLTSLQVDNTVYSIPQGSSGPTDIITEEEYADMLSQGTVSPDTIYYIEGTSDNTLSVTAATTSYDNTSSGLTATNVQSAIDELVTEVSGKQDTLTFDSSPTQGSSNPVTSGGVYTSLQGKQDILTLQALAALLGLTEAQLNNLITFAKSITSATTGSATISGTITADTFNTNQ